jgi:hypothetical protein
MFYFLKKNLYLLKNNVNFFFKIKKYLNFIKIFLFKINFKNKNVNLLEKFFFFRFFLFYLYFYKSILFFINRIKTYIYFLKSNIFFLKKKPLINKLKKKKLKKNFIFLKKKKIKIRKKLNLKNSFFFIKRLKINRLFNNFIYKQKNLVSYDCKGKYSSLFNYNWIFNYLSEYYNSNIRKNIFNYKKYFKKVNIIKNLKKKSNFLKKKITFFEKNKIANNINNDLLLDPSLIYMQDNKKLYVLYLYDKKKINLKWKRKLKKNLKIHNINENQLELPYRFFNKYKKKSYINWK